MIVLVTILSLPLVSESNSQVIFDNGGGGAAGHNIQFVSDSSFPFFPLGVIHADDVTFGIQHTITGIQWTGTHFDQLANMGSAPAVDNFNISIFLDNSGLPASTPVANFNVGNAVNRVDSGFDVTAAGAQLGNSLFEFSAAINFTANAGTTYWFSIVNDTFDSTTNVDDLNDFHWGGLQQFDSNQQIVGNAHVSTDNAANWEIANGARILDFRLEGFPVPEPGSTLIIACAGALALVRRRTA